MLSSSASEFSDSKSQSRESDLLSVTINVSAHREAALVKITRENNLVRVFLLFRFSRFEEYLLLNVQRNGFAEMHVYIFL